MRGRGPKAPETRSARHASRASRFRTLEGCHVPPRAVTISPSFNAAASADKDVIPRPRRSSITGRNCRARSFALCFTASTAAKLPLWARLSAAAPFGLPKRCPRAFVACRASVVRLEIALRSACATAAMICTVNSFASGMSAAMNLTLLS